MPKLGVIIRGMRSLHILGLVFLFITLNTTAGEAATQVEGLPHEVFISMGIIDIDAINTDAQSFTVNLFVQFRWHDPTLKHENEFPIREQLVNIRAPRFLLLNEQKSWSKLSDIVDINPSGEVIYRMRLWGDFSQIMRLQNFPLDSHTFQIPIVALGHFEKTIKLLPDPREDSFMAKQLSVADWSIAGWSAEPKQINMETTKVMNGFVFSFEAKRIVGFYFIKYIIPLFLIVAMSWVVFWIDPSESGSQLSVAVTSVLTLIAYHIALSNNLPDIAYVTRMDLLLFGSTLLVFLSLIEVVITSRLGKTDRLALAQSIDVACRIVFPILYGALAYMSLYRG